MCCVLSYGKYEAGLPDKKRLPKCIWYEHTLIHRHKNMYMHRPTRTHIHTRNNVFEGCCAVNRAEGTYITHNDR